MDVERTIEFLLQQTAKNEAEIGRIQVEIGRILQVQDRQVTVLTRLAEAQINLTEAQVKTEEKLSTFIAVTNERQGRTDHAINALMDVVDRILPRLPKQ
jgi:Zn finger protein HypA/HybF involved in hydrogenase expression